MKTIRILILEDDLETLSVLTNKLFKFEEECKDNDVAVTIFSEYTQIIDYVNKSGYKPDLIALDYDCKACGSFHALDFDKFKVPIIAISTQPEYNLKAVEKGAIECRKNLFKLDEWGNKMIELIKEMI